MSVSVKTPIQRQWQILISLMSRRQGQTIKEMAHEVGVNSRTIRRDLDTLRGAGFPLQERVTEHGRKHWAIAEGGTQVPIQFNWSEAVALYLGRRLLDPLAGTNFWQAAQTAFAKIRAMLGEAALVQLGKLSHEFLPRPGSAGRGSGRGDFFDFFHQTMPGRSDYEGKAELIDHLMVSIEDHRIAFVAYQSERATEPVSLEMYPYGIVYHKGSLYLVAFSRDHNKIRHFKIDRVSGVDVQTLQFTPDANFNLQKHLSNSFGIFGGEEHLGNPQKIRIRFSSEAARYVQEKAWHTSQRLTKEKDGSVILEVHLDHTHEIKSWVLGFGPKATVLEPASLRDEIVRDLEEVLKSYHPKQRVAK